MMAGQFAIGLSRRGRRRVAALQDQALSQLRLRIPFNQCPCSGGYGMITQLGYAMEDV